MLIPGDQWPVFIYHGFNYNPDDPWNGAFQSALLVSVSIFFRSSFIPSWYLHGKAYKYIFTSPSSVDTEPKATRTGNARIHGMTQVTPASLAYVATQVCIRQSFPAFLMLFLQVRFALSSSPVFSKSDQVTDSERFYSSVLDLFYDIDERKEVDDLLAWWNR
jgi:hypothetical protein